MVRFIKAIGIGAGALCASPLLAAQTNDTDNAAPKIAFNQVLPVAVQAPTNTADEAEAQIGAVVILGNETIDDAAFQPAIEEFFGSPMTEEVLAELTNEIAQLARDRGYDYARSEIVGDPNALGIVQIKVDEGRIDRVAIEGYDNDQARRILERLVGEPARKADLERALLLVSDIPAVRLRGARFDRDQRSGVLVVRLAKRETSVRIAADNYGSQSFGPWRARSSIRARDVLSSSDQLRAAVRINPVDLSELLFVSGSYSSQIGADGVTLGLSGSIGETAPGGVFGDVDISGDSVRLGANITAPLRRSKNSSLWVEGGVNYISIEQENLGAMLRDDTVVTAQVGLRTMFAVGDGRVRAGVSHVRGLGILGATRFGDTLVSRSDGDGVFSKIEFWGDARFPLVGNLDLYLAAGGQLADRPLLGSEELGLGGAYRTRGYNFSEVLGDEGIYGLAELRYSFDTDDLPLDWLQVYAFFDGGYVSDIRNDFGEGSLFSAGPGIRARIGDFDLEAEAGFPLGGSGERSDDDGPEINLRAGVNF